MQLSQAKHRQGGGKLAYSCFSSSSLLSLAEYLAYQGELFAKECFSNETCLDDTGKATGLKGKEERGLGAAESLPKEARRGMG